jgi:negative regulator of sigma E activity
MKKDQLLQLQAWVDGELPDAEARSLAESVRDNSEAQALVQELRLTKSFLIGNEPEACLPAAESREFYWNKIQRAIEREGAVVRTESEAITAIQQKFSWLMAWRRLLAPASALALVALLSVLSLNLYHQPPPDDSLQQLVEVENLSEHVGSISYKSQSENMFVVYLYNKDQEPQGEDDLDFFPADAPAIQ